jgi:zinc and cadmium transporter
MANYVHVIFFSLVGGVFSLIGGVLLLSKKSTAAILAKYTAPFAAGALLAAAFFDLLPEAIEISAEGTATRWALAGIVTFFLLEHFLHWFHHHHEHPEDTKKATVPLIVIGDSLHNLLDGIAIGAAFLISVPTGIITAIAVATHEIPQEVGDFGLLLKAGLRRKKVLLINVLSALMSTLGAVLTFWIGSRASLPLGPLLAITAGMFIYIAASDVIPEIHESARDKIMYAPALLLLAGVLIVGLATEIAHNKVPEGHNDSHIESRHNDHHREDDEPYEAKDAAGVCAEGYGGPCNGPEAN